MGSAWYELAVITAGDNMTPGESEALVGAYLERPPTDAELELLRACQGIYRYLELLWYLAPDREITAGPDLAGRLHALEASLFSPGSW